MFEKDTYEQDTESFQKIDSSQAETLLNSKELTIIYIDRKSCPFCRKFAKTLHSLSDKISTTIYYVDTENYNDHEISSFRKKYNIVTVPGFVLNKNCDITVLCDSSTSEDEILNIIK